MNKLMDLYSLEDQLEMKKMFDMGLPSKGTHQLKGYKFIPGFCAESAQYAYKNWDVRKNDVLVVSFPKTGNTWGADIVRRILFQDEHALAVTSNFPFTFRYLEFGGPKKFELFDKLPFERRTIASHLPAELVNMEKIKRAKAKVVYVLRNPKDQIISWLKFVPNAPPGQLASWKLMLNSGWDKYLEHIMAGDFDIHTKADEWYPEHILSWYKHRDNKTVYFVHFEDLKKDLRNQIKLIADFLEIPLSEEKAKEIEMQTSFSYIKEHVQEVDYEMLQMFLGMNLRKDPDEDVLLNAENVRNDLVCEVGGWKDYFTVRQSERLDAMVNEKLKDTDIKFSYE